MRPRMGLPTGIILSSIQRWGVSPIIVPLEPSLLKPACSSALIAVTRGYRVVQRSRIIPFRLDIRYTSEFSEYNASNIFLKSCMCNVGHICKVAQYFVWFADIDNWHNSKLYVFCIKVSCSSWIILKVSERLAASCPLLSGETV